MAESDQHLHRFLRIMADSNALAPIVASLAAYRYARRWTPIARYLGRELQVLVTTAIIRETRNRALPNIASYLWGRGGGLYGAKSEEELLEVLQATLDDALEREAIVDVAASRAYRKQMLAVTNRPSRRVLLKMASQLVICVRERACREQTRTRDLHVVASLALVYDVAVAVPLATRAGVAEGTLLFVTGDKDLYCSLKTCLEGFNIGYVLVRPYGWFKHYLGAWAAREKLEENPYDPKALEWFNKKRVAAQNALREYEEWCKKRWCGRRSQRKC